KSRQAFLDEFHQIITKHKNKQIVIFMHHPLFSNGSHGGFFSAKQHLFPITAVKKNAYIPLPGLGSIAPSYRALIGAKQDIVHTHYKELKNELLLATKHAKNVIFASGHEHGLQYTKDKQHHFVVSGAGSKTSFMKTGNGADFVASKLGYSKVYYYESKEVWLEFIAVENNTAKVIFRKKIIDAPAGTEENEHDHEHPEITQDSFRMAVNADYDKGSKFKKVIMGSHYRELWGTEVTARIINLDTEKGGLIPIKKGGGTMSNSLRMETKEGKQYVLRSIDKYLEKALPEDFRNISSIKSVIKDQTSTMHPFSAMVLPSMAEAAGIYYHKPELVYLPHQKGLGAYNDLFEEGLYLLEGRATGDRSDLDNVGNSKNTMGYTDVVKNLNKSTMHVIDQEWVLRSRLFDTFIHDWDRHDDNWRWASFEEGDKIIYRPIPRDRDQTFFEINGLIPGFASLFVRRLRPFRENIRDVKGFNFNGRNFDRYYLNDLDRSEWMAAIEDLKKRMTDEVIEDAFEVWPTEIQAKNAASTIVTLKVRRERLDIFAMKLYDFIAKEVDVRGTNKKELFEIEHLENGNVHVRAYVSNKAGDKKEKYFDRIFLKKETKEVRIFALDGKDHFRVMGDAKKKIRVRIIGGQGADDLIDNSKGKKTIAHDDKDGMTIAGTGSIKDKRNNSLHNNSYDRVGFKYNSRMPAILFGYNADDRVWIGAGLTLTKQGFRKSPYKSKQKFAVRTAPGSRGTFSINYEGDFIEKVGKLDLLLKGDFENPAYMNYFGATNNIDLPDSELTNKAVRNYWIRMRSYKVATLLKKRFGADKFDIKFGPTIQNIELENISGRILDELEEFDEDDFEPKIFAGLMASFNINTVDKESNPKHGIRLHIGTEQRFGLNAEQNKSGLAEASVTNYLTFGTKVQLTIANRLGGAFSWGDAEFYQNPTLGNSNYLRGHRNQRFNGESIFYNNLDLRIKLFSWSNKILPMDIGLLGGFDVAKVWSENSPADQFRKTYTAGLWISPVSSFIINPHVSFSDEKPMFTFSLGFNF
ncbi:MAG: hypothetical protein ACI94Y_003406, partial [Maribacter sp.]